MLPTIQGQLQEQLSAGYSSCVEAGKEARVALGYGTPKSLGLPSQVGFGNALRVTQRGAFVEGVTSLTRLLRMSVT
jgi:hypothetical protein